MSFEFETLTGKADNIVSDFLFFSVTIQAKMPKQTQKAFHLSPHCIFLWIIHSVAVSSTGKSMTRWGLNVNPLNKVFTAKFYFFYACNVISFLLLFFLL